MDYNQLIETISAIVENDQIQKYGLSLIYKLDEKTHRKIDEEIYYKLNPYNNDFTPNDEFEVVIGGIIIKFIK